MKPIWVEVECAGVEHDQIADAALDLCLAAKEMGMKTPPGTRHWHITKPGFKGTLEITWLPNGHLTIEARANRFADWQPAATEQLVKRFTSDK